MIFADPKGAKTLIARWSGPVTAEAAGRDEAQGVRYQALAACACGDYHAKNATARVIKACTGVADADSHCVSDVYLLGDSIMKGTDSEFSLKIQNWIP